ncbi:MAG: 23S rRNA (guanosine(2251)-2'-O)-methyltransferase RlmB [Bacteroidales bacterium]|nr:23S rRNA (guanosine(2251)-2'-O)-methyltransferase RlmB [Bacteroidales bacterium]MDD5974646.1 23S rRNA (guanosine(2251)-2'-O)-methyltransferase RlmB [Bacteroidales bacterium]MDY5194595.1 23S rRNA (guanosine(2251)-2'-O)-methyltransferase RlmB [Candidatus Aphodosoma sp.]
MKEKNMIFGIRAVIEAINAGKEIEKIFIRREMGGDLLKELFDLVQERKIPVQKVPLEKLNRLTTKNHQGVVAYISSIEYQHIENIIPMLYESGKDPFIVILDGVTDVRNFGAIARTCECAGVDAIVMPMRGGAAANADAVKTSAGALHIIPVCRENSLHNTVSYLQKCGIKVVAASEKASHLYSQADYSGPLAIVMGAEDVGISPDILRIVDDMVSIPICGQISSLNVSVATGVIVYEAVKQRR